MTYKYNYFEGREANATEAKKHTEEMENRYHDKIVECIRSTKIYGPDKDVPFNRSESIKRHTSLVDMDTVQAILSLQKKGYGRIAVLNFASYKNPGGMFIEGSMAQEEALCHASFLYNVLKEFDGSFYQWNRNHKHKGLYQNRALYSPNVVFERGSLKGTADVITCAAPNLTAAKRYNDITDEENLATFKDRAKFVADIAIRNEVDTIILGAWGCGVFGQNPEMIARLLSRVFTQADIAHVKFAVPSKLNPENFEAFDKALKGIC